MTLKSLLRLATPQSVATRAASGVAIRQAFRASRSDLVSTRDLVPWCYPSRPRTDVANVRRAARKWAQPVGRRGYVIVYHGPEDANTLILLRLGARARAQGNAKGNNRGYFRRQVASPRPPR